MGKKGGSTNRSSLDDWISNLASSSVETAVASKADRIATRHAKKRRRQDRKDAKIVGRRDTLLTASKNTTLFDKLLPNSTQQQQTAKRLRVLSAQVRQCVENQQAKWPNPYNPTNSLVKLKKANNTLQPRKNDYGGIGLARPSLWIALDDPSWQPKLEEEFAEHVQGFFGKQRTKAMKRQLNGNMLWKKLQTKQVAGEKINGKLLSSMTPDEKVEAMLQAGMI